MGIRKGLVAINLSIPAYQEICVPTIGISATWHNRIIKGNVYSVPVATKLDISPHMGATVSFAADKHTGNPQPITNHLKGMRISFTYRG